MTDKLVQRRLDTHHPSRSSPDYDAQKLDPAIEKINLEALTSGYWLTRASLGKNMSHLQYWIFGL